MDHEVSVTLGTVAMVGFFLALWAVIEIFETRRERRGQKSPDR